MSNQKLSPSNTSLIGSIGPIEMMWQYFIEHNDIGQLTPIEVSRLKLVHYTTAMQMYNAFALALRHDPIVLATMSEGMMQDLNAYFNQSGPSVVH